MPAVLTARSLQPRLEGTPGDLTDDLCGLVPARLDAGSFPQTGFHLYLATPDRTETLSPQIIPSVAGIQTVFFSFAIRFALLEPHRVWVGG